MRSSSARRSRTTIAGDARLSKPETSQLLPVRSFRFPDQDRIELLKAGLSEKIIAALESAADSLISDHGSRTSSAAEIVPGIQVSREAGALADALSEASKSIAKTSQWTRDHIDLRAHGRASLLLNNLRNELNVLAVFAFYCAEENRTTRTGHAEVKRHAAMLTGQILLQNGHKLDGATKGIFAMVLRKVFAALGIDDPPRNTLTTALKELIVTVPRGKPRGHKGRPRIC